MSEINENEKSQQFKDLESELRLVRAESEKWQRIALRLAAYHSSISSYTGAQKTSSKARLLAVLTVCKRSLGWVSGLDELSQSIRVEDFRKDTTSSLEETIQELETRITQIDQGRSDQAKQKAEKAEKVRPL